MMLPENRVVMQSEQGSGRKDVEAEHFRLLVENIRDWAVFVIDRQGLVQTWNLSAERLLGYREDEIIGRPVEAFFTPEDIRAGLPRQEMHEALQGRHGSDDRWHVRKDGSRFWSGGMMTPLRDETGNLRGFAKIMRDRTEWKRQEETLKESEEWHRAMANVTSDFTTVCRVCEDGSIIVDFVTEGFQKATGYSLEEMNAKGGWKTLVWPDDLLVVQQSIDYWLSGEDHSSEIRIVTKRGETRWLAYRGCSASDPQQGRVTRLYTAAQDITERKLAQERLREQQEWLRVTLASIGDGIIATDRQGRVAFLNGVAEQLTGWTQLEVQGLRLETVIHFVDEQTRQRVEDPVQKVLRERGTVTLENHTVLIHRDGIEAPIGVSAAPIQDGVGDFIGVVLVFRDATEHRRSERMLQKREEQLRLVTDHAPAFLAYCDREGRYKFVNKGYAERFGLTPQDVIGKRIPDVVGEQAYSVFRHYVEAALAGSAVEFEIEVPYDRIGRHVMHCSYAPEFDGSGQVQGLVAVISDVTPRKRAEESLRHSEERFRSLMEQAPFSIQVFSTDGRTIRVNRAWEELWGVRFEQIEGYNILEDRQVEAKGVLHLIHRAFAGQAAHIPAVQYDLNETIPDISPHEDPCRWLSAVIYPIKDADGRVREVVLIHEDITARKRAEDALRESEEKLRLLADTIPQLAWMATPDGYIFWYNRRWYEYTGTTPEEMEGWGWQSVHDPDVLPKVLGRWKASIASGEPFDMVFPLKGADGQFRPFLTRVNPLWDEAGRILYWCGTNTDISEIKRMEEALRLADRRKDEFLAMLAHELRNPLAPIRNSLQILRMPRVDAETARQTKDLMERQVLHLVRLVDDLLDVSRVMRGKIVLRKEAVELATVVARAVEMAQPLIEIQGHRLDILLPPEMLLLDGDPVRLAQVVGNLLTNAAKYTEANGRIRLTARRDGSAAVVSVRDNGVGIAPDMMPHVFELFVQADHVSTNAQGGLGIGLTLVRNLVEMHGGTVEAHSAGLGTGSEFVVRLPLVAQESSEPTRESNGAQRRDVPPSGHRLLVVDDNVDAAISLAVLLRLQGHEVQVANDGPSGLKLAATFRPHLVFLDLGMPGMNGYEVARKMRQQDDLKNVVLAALTGWGQPEDRRRTIEAGFNHHLVKPPEPEELGAILASLSKPDD